MTINLLTILLLQFMSRNHLIDTISAIDMTPDLFFQKYAFTNRPVVIKNAAKNWKALQTFNYEFLKSLYESVDDLNGCGFHQSPDTEFGSMQEVIRVAGLDQIEVKLKFFCSKIVYLALNFFSKLATLEVVWIKFRSQTEWCFFS